MNGVINHLPIDSFPESGSTIPFVVKIPKGTVFAWDENMRNVDYQWTLTENLPSYVFSLRNAAVPEKIGEFLAGKMANGASVTLTITSVALLSSSKRVQLTSNNSHVTSASFTSTRDFYYIAYA